MNPDREQRKHLVRLVKASLENNAMLPWWPCANVAGVSSEAAVTANGAIWRAMR